MRQLTPDFALLDAIRRGSKQDIRQAISDGANIHCCTLKGLSTLQQAIQYSQNDLVDLLVSLGADPNQTIGKRSETLLHKAASSGNIGFTSALLRNHADPNIQNSYGQTPLYIAARDGYEYIARALLKSGADASICANNGSLPEAVAFQHANTTISRLLFEKRTSAMSAPSWGARVATDDPDYISRETNDQFPSR